MLSGQLGPIGLDEVVGFLHTNGLEGVLTVVGAAASLSLVLQQGRLVYPDPRAGRLGPEAIDELLARANGIERVRARRLSRGQVDELLGRARALVSPASTGRASTGRLGVSEVDAILGRAAELRGDRPSGSTPRPSGGTSKPIKPGPATAATHRPTGSGKHEPVTQTQRQGTTGSGTREAVPGSGKQPSQPGSSGTLRPVTTGKPPGSSGTFKAVTPSGSGKQAPQPGSSGTFKAVTPSGSGKQAPQPGDSGSFNAVTPSGSGKQAPQPGGSGSFKAAGEKPRTGRLDKDALESLQARAEALDPEQTRHRARLAEQVHELFNWKAARFEFRPVSVPDGLVSDIADGGGLVLEPTALLMEVARRADERSRNPAEAASRTRTTRRLSLNDTQQSRKPSRAPFLEGDLDGVGLAALLQTLRAKRRCGTLMVTAGPREEHLYFDAGEAFVLRADVKGAEEFAASFLGDAADSVVQLASAGVVDERSLSEGEQRVIKDKFLDVLFWDAARFCFYLDDLPSAFLRLPPGVTKIALQTDRFLLEAIQRMIEWDSLRDVVRAGQVVFAFASPEAKLQAVRGASQTSLFTLIDGRHTFDDLVRVSREPRLDVGRAVADLARRGLVRAVE